MPHNFPILRQQFILRTHHEHTGVDTDIGISRTVHILLFMSSAKLTHFPSGATSAALFR